MPKNLRIFALSLGLVAAATLSYGQTTTTTPPVIDTTTATPPADGTAAAPAADAVAPADLAMGTTDTAAAPPALPTQAEAALNGLYLAAKFDDWEQRCIKTADGSDPCQLYQLLKDKDGNSVAEVSLFALPDGGDAAVGATVIVPLETLLTANLRVGVDAAAAKVYPFNYCTPQGCIARIGFNAADLAGLKKGNTATITIVPAVAPDKTVSVVMSLKGLTAGYTTIKALPPK